jgi:hypothetical protein
MRGDHGGAICDHGVGIWDFDGSIGECSLPIRERNCSIHRRSSSIRHSKGPACDRSWQSCSFGEAANTVRRANGLVNSQLRVIFRRNRGSIASAHADNETGDADGGEEAQDKETADAKVSPIRRKDEDEAAVLDEGGEAGDAERHEEETKDLPAVELGGRIGACGAEDEGDADDGAEAEGGEPNARPGIEIADKDYQVPDEVAPQGLAGAVESGEIG